MKSIFQGNPFEPTEIEAIAIMNVGLMFAHILILLFFILLMNFLVRKKDYIPVLITYLFSLLVGMESLTHLHTPFSPSLEIFLLIFQTGVFITYVLKIQELKKEV